MTSFLISFLELIDTLWNVNEVELSTDELVQQRINRYIMECKFEKLGGKTKAGRGINRYIMECK